MPIVQRYGQRQVGTAPLPGARKTAAETPLSQGAGLAEAKAHAAGRMADAFGVLGQIGQRMVEEERQRADEAALLEAENKLAAWEHARLYDPEKGALAVKGKDSFGLPETVAGEYSKVTSEIEAALTTPRQKEAFARVKAQRAQSIDLVLRRHVFNEMERWEAGELKAFIENKSAHAILAGTDPETGPQVVAETLAQIEHKIAIHGPRAGLGEEALRTMQAEARSRVHVGLIDRFLAEDKPALAKAYYEETRDQIHDPDGWQIAQIERALEEGGLRQQAQRKADEIMASAKTKKDALAAAREVKDPKLRDEVVQRVKQRWAEKDQIERDEHDEMMRRAADIIDKTGSYDRIPPGDIAKMSAGERDSLREYARKKALGYVSTNWERYYGLLQQADKDPTGFATVNLMAHRHELEDTEFKQLVALQSSIRDGRRDQTLKALQDYRSESQVIEDSLRQIGVDPDDKNRATALAWLRQKVGERTAYEQIRVGRKLSNVEIQDIVDQFLSVSAGAKKGSWWSILPGGAPFFDQPAKGLLEITPKDIDGKERRQIEAALEKAGLPVNDDTILRLYLDTQARLKGLVPKGLTDAEPVR